MAPPDAPWPDRKLLTLLRHLAIDPTAARHSVPFVGQHSNRRGLSIDPADSRAYVQGDDLRHLDWGQLAKFDQLVVRLFYAQHAMRVTIALDCSASMTLGTPRKFDFARSLAACLSIIALQGRSELTLLPSPQGPPRRCVNASASRSVAMADILAQLRALEAGGVMDMPELLRRAARQNSDMLIFISDCLPPRNLTSTFAALAAHGQRLIVLHTLCPQEQSPTFQDSVMLRDLETGRRQHVSGSQAAGDAYHAALERWCHELRESVTRCGGVYRYISTSTSIEEVLTRNLLDVLTTR